MNYSTNTDYNHQIYYQTKQAEYHKLEKVGYISVNINKIQHRRNNTKKVVTKINKMKQ